MLGAGKSQSEQGEPLVEPLQGSGPNATAFAFGKYHLFASLGRGGMADVFLAVSRGPMGFNKLVVIKRLRPALAEEASFRNMFLDEARLAARLNHPNVVHTYEVGEHNGIYFIAMEYLEGQSLNKVIKEAVRRNEVIDPVYCARLVSDALSGLHHAHELRDYDGRPLNIIHRDVSPHNVFATYDGHVKLVDFGIAKAALSSTETEVGVLKGKVAYMAPEQAMGGPIDHRADIFAMGIVLWELLARQRLMTGDSAANTLHRLMNMPIPRVSELVNVDPALDDIVARALEKDVNLRFQSAAEMRDALEGWIQSTGRLIKQDDIGRFIGCLFQRVREEVQRQIQSHMAVVATAQSTGELQALTLDSLRRMEQNGSTKLLRLGTSGSGAVSAMPAPTPLPPEPSHGSGSGSVPSMQMPLHSMPIPSQSMRTQKEGSGARVVLLLLGLLIGLALLVTLAVVLRPRARPAPVALNDTATVPPVLATPPPTTAAPVDPAPPTSAASAQAPAPPDSAIPAPTGRRPVAHPVQTHKPPTPPPSPPPSANVPPPSTNDDPGFLTLQTYPFTRVYEGGRALGTTPLYKVALTPGSHTLTLENPEQGIKQTYTVNIKSGETSSRNLGLK
jgi:eukaryotic-like serine/threonine-protein kinase